MRGKVILLRMVSEVNASQPRDAKGRVAPTLGGYAR